jgi:hypothetical protein
VKAGPSVSAEGVEVKPSLCRRHRPSIDRGGARVLFVRRTMAVGLTVVVASVLASAAAGAGASKPFVTAKIPLNQTVKTLLRGKFVQKVTCARTCKVIARIFIMPQVARKLQFGRVMAGEPYAIALKQLRLRGEHPTRVRMALGRDAKKRLGKWKGRHLQVTGETYASSTSSGARGQANWITLLRR